MKILVVEDDADIAANIGQFFEERGHALDFAYSGRQGLQLALAGDFDLIVLDLMLPGIDGLRVCREFRAQSRADTPILMLTARDTLDDKIEGFDAGTDDYLVKPFSLLELEARVAALARRGQRASTAPVLRVADLELDRDRMRVTRAGETIALKPRAFEILDYLMANAERVVPRQELIDHVWGEDPPAGDPLRVHIHDLRKQVDRPHDGPALIHTVHGVGYRVGSEA